MVVMTGFRVPTMVRLDYDVGKTSRISAMCRVGERVKLLSIETTPNPNSMKLNLDERLAKGVAITYTHENRGDCPAYIEKILAIPGVSSVFRVEDFMAIQRKPTAGWEDILSQLS